MDNIKYTNKETFFPQLENKKNKSSLIKKILYANSNVTQNLGGGEKVLTQLPMNRTDRHWKEFKANVMNRHFHDKRVDNIRKLREEADLEYRFNTVYDSKKVIVGAIRYKKTFNLGERATEKILIESNNIEGGASGCDKTVIGANDYTKGSFGDENYPPFVTLKWKNQNEAPMGVSDPKAKIYADVEKLDLKHVVLQIPVRKGVVIAKKLDFDLTMTLPGDISMMSYKGMLQDMKKVHTIGIVFGDRHAGNMMMYKGEVYATDFDMMDRIGDAGNNDLRSRKNKYLKVNEDATTLMVIMERMGANINDTKDILKFANKFALRERQGVASFFRNPLRHLECEAQYKAKYRERRDAIVLLMSDRSKYYDIYINTKHLCDMLDFNIKGNI